MSLNEQCLALPLGPLTCIPLQQAGVLPAAPSCCANAAFQFLWLSFLLVLTQGLWDLYRKGDGVQRAWCWESSGPMRPLQAPPPAFAPHSPASIIKELDVLLNVRYLCLPPPSPCPPSPSNFLGPPTSISRGLHVVSGCGRPWDPVCTPRPFYLPPIPNCYAPCLPQEP